MDAPTAAFGKSCCGVWKRGTFGFGMDGHFGFAKKWILQIGIWKIYRFLFVKSCNSEVMLLFLDSNGTTQLKRAPCPLSSNSVRSRVRFNGVLLRDALETSLSQESSYGNLYNTASRSWHVWMIDTFTASLFGKMCFGWEKRVGFYKRLCLGMFQQVENWWRDFSGQMRMPLWARAHWKGKRPGALQHCQNLR